MTLSVIPVVTIGALRSTEVPVLSLRANEPVLVVQMCVTTSLTSLWLPFTISRSLSVESMIVLLSLVAWTVVLTEVYWDEGVAPVGYFQLIFWSTFVAGAFGRSLGIVMGYRREISVDA